MFKNMGKTSLGFLVCFKNAKKESCLTMDLCCVYSLMLKALQPLLLLYVPVLLQLLTQTLYFPSQAIPLDASNQTLPPLPSFHISALHLTSQGAA